jgi:acetaldehyde dehydrogenase
MTTKVKAAILGSGHIGTDLMIKILRHGQYLEVAAMVGIDPSSEGLERARRLRVAATHEGAEGLAKLPVFDEIATVFDVTSSAAQ